MKPFSKYNTWVGFVGGVITGLVIYQVALRVNGLSVVSREHLVEQRSMLDELQEENRELTEELFRPRVLAETSPVGDDLPYADSADARAEVASARKAARDANKFLMVTFGANWCVDCRTLHLNLKSDDVKQYTQDRFLFVNVDVGKFNLNADLAAELGVSLSRGIPVAIFFDPSGAVIGTTNNGELEPARRYSSIQILKFIRDIAERSQVIAPDRVRPANG